MDSGELTREKVEASCPRALSLFRWIEAVRNYFLIYRDAEPVRDKLMMCDLEIRNQTVEKEKATKHLKEIQTQLNKVYDDLKIKEKYLLSFMESIDECFYMKTKGARLLNELQGEAQKWRV